MVLLWSMAEATTKNGFDLTNATVASKDIVRGGPPRDGIMSLTNPEFASADDGRIGKIAERLVLKLQCFNWEAMHFI